MVKLERLVITCGGTGGHFYPGMAAASAFLKDGGKVKLLLSGVNSEKQRECAGDSGIEAVALPVMPHPSGVKQIYLFMRGLFSGFFAARRELRDFKAQALLGMGSFASLPAILAARALRIPVFLHDGNARIGKANRWCSRLARFVATAFPAVNRKSCSVPVIESGMPLRESLESRRQIGKAEAVAELNAIYGTALRPELFTYLITGGSQGAASLNCKIPEALMKKGKEGGFQVLHLTGKGKLTGTDELYRNAGFPVLITESSERMELFFGAADLVFSRSGGSTVAELSLFGLPAVLIPYPYAAEDHQADNARYFTDNGAGVMVRDSELTPERAAELLAIPPAKWSECAGKSVSLARPQAARVLLDMIEAKL